MSLRCELVNLKKLNVTSISPEAFQNSKDMVKFYCLSRKKTQLFIQRLQQRAKKYLCIPGTSVPSERLFSKAGELISNRHRLKSECNMILFSNKNCI